MRSHEGLRYVPPYRLGRPRRDHGRVVERLGECLSDQGSTLDLNDDQTALLIDAEEIEPPGSGQVELALDDHHPRIDQRRFASYPSLEVLFQVDRGGLEPHGLRGA